MRRQIALAGEQVRKRRCLFQVFQRAVRCSDDESATAEAQRVIGQLNCRLMRECWCTGVSSSSIYAFAVSIGADTRSRETGPCLAVCGDSTRRAMANHSERWCPWQGPRVWQDFACILTVFERKCDHD